MDFKNYDLIVKYTTCSGKRQEKKWNSIEDFHDDINTKDIEKLFEIPMHDDYDIEAIFFGHTGDIKHFETIKELVDFCNKNLFAVK